MASATENALAGDGSPAPPPELVERLRASLGRRYGSPDRWAIEMIRAKGPPGREHRLFRAHDPETGTSIAMKADSLTRRNREQFHALRRLRERTEECVAPLYLASDERFFAMEWVEAPLLAVALRGSDRHRVLAHAGDWLARLRCATLRRPVFWVRRHRMRLPDARDDEVAQAAYRGILARMKRTPRRFRRVSMLHGDFHPANLFFTGSKLLAFDRQFDRHGNPFYDAATFLLDVELIRRNTTKAGHPPGGDIESDRRAFFEGYGPLRERDLPLYDLVEDVVLYQKWRNDRRAGRAHRDDLMLARGLMDPGRHCVRPGRLVKASGKDGEPSWRN